MSSAATPTDGSINETFGTLDIIVAAGSLGIGLIFELGGIALFGTPYTFSIFFLLGAIVMSFGGLRDRALLFDASVATFAVTFVAFSLNVAGRFLDVFPLGFQVFCAVAVAAFFGTLYGWRRSNFVRRVVEATFGFVTLPECAQRLRPDERNGLAPWLWAVAAICSLVAIVDFGFPAAYFALGGLAVAIYAFVKRRQHLAFHASSSALAALFASLMMSIMHVPFTVNALVCTAMTYIITLYWRDIPYARAAFQRIERLFDGATQSSRRRQARESGPGSAPLPCSEVNSYAMKPLLSAFAPLLAISLATGCAKPTSDSSGQSTMQPSPPADETPGTAATNTASPGGPPSPGPAASPETSAEDSPAASAGVSVATSSLPIPTGTDVAPFDGSGLVAAYAAQANAVVNQGDAAEYALLAADSNLICEGIRKDFADDFAAHRSADKYASFLSSHAKPLGLSSIDLPTSLGQYDFNGKRFQLAPGYGDGSKTFTFDKAPTCAAPWTIMPDKSRIPYGVALEVDNASPLHLYTIDPNQAEKMQKEAYRYAFTEHLVFYPIAIARREDGRIGTVVHVTKVTLEQRPAGSPANTVPTIPMSVDLP